MHPRPIGFFSAPQFERQSFFLGDRVQSSGIGLAGYDSVELITSLIHHLFSLSALSSFSLFLPQLNELFRKSEVHKDFMSVRVRNLEPSNSIVALVEAHFKPGERSLKGASDLKKKLNNDERQ